MKKIHSTLSVVLLAISQATFSQVEPGIVEPAFEAPLPEAESAVIVDTDDGESLQAEGAEGSATSELSFDLESIGLDYFPNNASLNVDVVAALESTIRAFVLSSDGSSNLPQLEQLAGELTGELRQSGYVLAQVFLPPQKVSDGSVVLRVMPGLLGSVASSGNTLYSSNQLERSFDSLLEKPVDQNEIESRLLRLNDLPGFGATGSFSADDRSGYTRMRLATREEDRLAFRARLDNHNVESTGDLRFIVGATANNPLGIRDQLDADVIQTFDSGDLTSVRVRYQLFSPNLVHRFGANYSQSDYANDSRASGIAVDGENAIGDLFWRAGWIRSLNLNVATQLSMSVKRAEQEIFSSNGEDRLTVANATLLVDNVDRRFNGLQGLNVSYHRGLNNTFGSLDSSGNPAPTASNRQGFDGGKFEKWRATLQRLQSITRGHNVLFRLAGQFTDDDLPSLEKMNLGGPYSVRSHEIGIASGSRSTFASVGWRFDAGWFSDAAAFGEYSWSDVLSFEIFADYGKVQNVGSSTTTRSAEASGAGALAEFELPDQGLRFQAIVASPFDDDFNGRQISDTRFWFSLTGEF